MMTPTIQLSSRGRRKAPVRKILIMCMQIAAMNIRAA